MSTYYKDNLVDYNANKTTPKLCFSCGKPIEKHKRRYCSQKCKEEFLFKLKWFNNLLRVLNTRYATFSFTETVLILNVITASSEEVYSYFYSRTPGKKPAHEINGMVFGLGELWWCQRNKTKSEKYASNHILKKGNKQIFSPRLVKPVEIKYFSGISKQMSYLKINKEDLLKSARVEETIKSAYRKAALRHHPDKGGDAEMFRKIHKAYQDLKNWLQNPSFQVRKGVPGQWCYVAFKSKWITPL